MKATFSIFRRGGIAILVAVVGVGALRYLDGWWLTVAVVPLLWLGYRSRQPQPHWIRAAMIGALFAVTISAGWRNLQVIERNLAQPPEWDFGSFWLFGRVAALGQGLYDPANFAPLAAPLKPSAEFVEEIVQVGFLYPPPTAFLFWPLGWFDMQSASLVWYLAHITLFTVCVVLIWQTFLPATGWLEFGLVAALGLSLPATFMNFFYAQTNLMTLLMMILFWRDRERARAGVWVALGFLVKPMFVLMALFLLVRRRWKSIAVLLAVIVGAYALSYIVFGATTFFAYFANNPSARLPAWYFSETGNISLYACLWRAFKAFTDDVAQVQWVFGATAVAMVVMSAWLIHRLPASADMWAVLLTATMALTLYPNSGLAYTLILLPLFVRGLAGNRFSDPIRWQSDGIFAMGVIAVNLGLGYHDGWSNLAAIVLASLWLAIFVASIILVRNRLPARDPQSVEPGI